MNKNIRVHFMGIGGSGMAPIAIIAKKMGYQVSGCDISAKGYYCDALINNEITVQVGHDIKHLEDIDILAITPAILDINPNHPEVVEGKKRNILMTWQQFSGQYLQNNRITISIAGTHGKSTTTVLMGLVLEDGGFDPIVEAGTLYRPWGGGYRIANSDYFVCEADEFNCNFHEFKPSIIIINNIEMDHPEFFNNYEEVKDAFKKFIRNIKEPKILVINEESEGIREILTELQGWLQSENVKVIGYYINKKFNFPFYIEYRGEILSTCAEGSEFNVYKQGWKNKFVLGVSGIFNIVNSLGVLCATLELGVSLDSIKSAFKKFNGIGRRFELIREKNGIKVFDDYGHHPTEISAVLETCRVNYPNQKIWAIMEPHQISRTRLFLDEYSVALNIVDQVIITKPYLGREINKKLEPIDISSFIEKIGKKKARYIEDFDEVSDYVLSNISTRDIVIVFGAGESYKLAQKIAEGVSNI